MRQNTGVLGLFLLLLRLIPCPLFIFRRDTGEALAKDATCCVGVPHSQYAFREKGRNMSERNIDILQITVEMNLCCQR